MINRVQKQLWSCSVLKPQYWKTCHQSIVERPRISVAPEQFSTHQLNIGHNEVMDEVERTIIHKNRWPFAIQCPQLRTCQKTHFCTMHAEYNMYKMNRCACKNNCFKVHVIRCLQSCCKTQIIRVVYKWQHSWTRWFQTIWKIIQTWKSFNLHKEPLRNLSQTGNYSLQALSLNVSFQFLVGGWTTHLKAYQSNWKPSPIFGVNVKQQRLKSPSIFWWPGLPNPNFHNACRIFDPVSLNPGGGGLPEKMFGFSYRAWFKKHQLRKRLRLCFLQKRWREFPVFPENIIDLVGCVFLCLERFLKDSVWERSLNVEQTHGQGLQGLCRLYIHHFYHSSPNLEKPNPKKQLIYLGNLLSILNLI